MRHMAVDNQTSPVFHGRRFVNYSNTFGLRSPLSKAIKRIAFGIEWQDTVNARARPQQWESHCAPTDCGLASIQLPNDASEPWSWAARLAVPAPRSASCTEPWAPMTKLAIPLWP